MLKKIITSFLVTTVLTLHISVCWAETLKENNSLGSYSLEAIKVIISLAIVLGIFYLLLNVFKKYTGVTLQNNTSLRILGGLSLGGKDKVVILEAGEINLLVGISSSGITKLHEFKENEITYSKKNVNQKSSFSKHVENILGNNKS